MQAAGDGRLAQSGAAQLADLIHVQGDCNGPAQALSVLPGVGQTGAYAFAKNLALEFGEHRQQSRHGSTGGRGQVQRFGQRDETDAVLELADSGRFW